MIDFVKISIEIKEKFDIDCSFCTDVLFYYSVDFQEGIYFYKNGNIRMLKNILAAKTAVGSDLSKREAFRILKKWKSLKNFK